MSSLAAAVSLRWEILIVLGLSLGRSAVYSVLSLVELLTRVPQLDQVTTTINRSQTPDRPWLDLSYQVANLVFPLMPVALVFYLLWVHQKPAGGPFRAMGFDLRRPGFDLGLGFATFAVIGSAGIGVYVAARELGFNTTVQPGDLGGAWWSVAVLVLRAVMNGVLEEVIMLGYLLTRWTQAGGRMVTAVVVSALIRGTYHLYQGWGGFVGNLAMGLVFGWLYARTGRVMPLVVAHTLLDVAVFVGYPLVQPHLPWL